MSAARRLERAGLLLGLCGVVWFLLTFLIFPLIAGLSVAFPGADSKGLFILAEELSAARRVREAVANTAWMTLATVFTVTVVGVLQVMFLDYFAIRGRSLLKIGFAVPLVFGSVVAAAGYRFVFGQTGSVTAVLTWLFPDLGSDWFEGFWAVLYAHTFLMTGLHYLFLRAALRRVDYSTVEAARSLGAKEHTILLRVVLPAVMPTLIAVTLLLTDTAMASFAVPEILGGRDFHMLSQMILKLNSLRRQDLAVILAMMFGVIVMSLIIASQIVEQRGRFTGGAKVPVPIQLKTIRNPVWNGIAHGIAYLFLAANVLPVLTVVLFSFAPAASIGVEIIPSSLSLQNYLKVFTDADVLQPLLNSLQMSGLAVFFGLAITLFSVPVMLKYDNWAARTLDLSFFLPWFLPGVLLAVGMILAFDTPNALVGGAILLGNWWIVPAAYTVIIMPLMVRFLRAAFVGIDPHYGEAAQSLGASALYRFRRISLPLILPTVVLLAGLKFNDLMTEYPVSAFLFNVNNRPLSLAIVDGARSADPEQRAVNLVYVTLIMAASMVIIVLAERLSMGRGPERNRL